MEETYPSDDEFSDEVDSDSSTDVDARLAEDDVFDIEFLKCYSALKKKDSKIYDEKTTFFNKCNESSSDEESTTQEEPATSKKGSGAFKMTLLDHQLNLKEEIDEYDTVKVDLTQPVSKSFYERELEDIKKSIEEVCGDADDESDDDLLKVKGEEKRDKKIIKNILDKVENDDDEDLTHLKELWSDPKNLTPEDRFLRDYILNKRYLKAVDDDVREDTKSFFSSNLEDISDVEQDTADQHKSKKSRPTLHSEEKGFDQIVRIPRDSTRTIRDIVEKQEKKEKRARKLEKEKKKKKALRNSDFEDIVGDLPTRFHYRETVPNDYGLSAEELLMATDEELDKWVSLHETVAYKPLEEELKEKSKFEKKRDDIELKRSIFKSIYGDSDIVDSEPVVDRKKSKRSKKKQNQIAEEKFKEADTCSEEPSKRKTKKKNKKRGLNHKKFAKAKVAPDRLLAYGLSKTKLRRANLL